MQEQGEEKQQKAGEGQKQCDCRFYALGAADETEEQQESSDKAGDGPEAVQTVYGINLLAAAPAGNGDDLHSGLADGAEEQAVRAVGFDVFALPAAGGKLQAYDLVADARTVFLQIVSQYLYYDGLFKAAALCAD